MVELKVNALPPSWEPKPSSATLSSLVDRTLVPSGYAYLGHVLRSIDDLSFDAYDALERDDEAQRTRAKAAGGAPWEDDLGVGDEPESAVLLSLDPKEWKKQDHYAVLGLSHLRYKATMDQIKIAHRKKVLKHHPDKKAGLAGHSANDDAFFKCIQKAYDVLTHPTRRAHFDSVDPHYLALEEEAITRSAAAALTERAFFETFAPIFEREARFSKVTPAPMLGAPQATKEAVEAFYDFWYNFDSWRSFEYLDKEVNEGSDSRDDKRFTEKKNKAERARRKKEDTARLRSLVDLTLSVDPRIKRIKQEEKAAREAKKRGKAPTPVNAKKSTEDEKKKKEEEDAKKEELEKIAKAEAKKAKVAAANAAKKARRQQRAAEEAAAN